MTQVKDYRVTLKVRNNRILKAIEAVGGTPGGKWCESVGVIYKTLNDLIGMKVSPVTRTGKLTVTAEALCTATNSLPYDLWSEEQMRPLERNTAELEVSVEDIAGLISRAEHDGVAAIEAKLFVERLLPKLTEREQAVLHMRFYEGMTLEETGVVINTQRERVRQIESKALRKLKRFSGEGY